MLFSHHDLHNFIANYGYWAVACFVALESMGIPLPGETILVLAAGYAGSHDGNIVVVIASAAVGAIIGDNVGYVVGRELGSRFLQRYGPMIGLTAARIKLGQYRFMRYGSTVVFTGRFIAILRFLAAFLAGREALSANAAGGILWATVVGMAAYSFGKELHRVQGPIGEAAFVLAGLVLV